MNADNWPKDPGCVKGIHVLVSPEATSEIVIGLAARVLDYAKQPTTALAISHFL